MTRFLTLFACSIWIAMSSGCSRPSDEERLRQLLDTTGVHLYVALKVLYADPGRDPDVRRTRELTEKALAAWNQSVALDAGKAPDLALGDTLAIGRALWALRGVGQAEVALGRASTLPPLLATRTEPEEDASVVAARDHALLLLALVLARIHPRVPTPVPDGAPVYEAWMAGGDATHLGELEPIARAAQAYVYASADLCDLAIAHTDQLASNPRPISEQELQKLLDVSAGLGRLVAHAPEGAPIAAAGLLAASLPWSSRLLAHVTTARCLDVRERTGDATREWQRTIDVGAQVGFAEPDLAFLRAYVAYRDGDPEAMRSHLETARASARLDARARADIEAFSADFDPRNRDAMGELFDAVFLARFVGGMTSDRLAEMGVFETLENVPVFRDARAVVSSLASLTEPPSDLWARTAAWFRSAVGAVR